MRVLFLKFVRQGLPILALLACAVGILVFLGGAEGYGILVTALGVLSGGIEVYNFLCEPKEAGETKEIREQLVRIEAQMTSLERSIGLLIENTLGSRPREIQARSGPKRDLSKEGVGEGKVLVECQGLPRDGGLGSLQRDRMLLITQLSDIDLTLQFVSGGLMQLAKMESSYKSSLLTLTGRGNKKERKRIRASLRGISNATASLTGLQHRLNARTDAARQNLEMLGAVLEERISTEFKRIGGKETHNPSAAPHGWRRR